MKVETAKIPVPLWILIIAAIMVVTALLAAWYYKIDNQSVKMIGVVGGVVSGLVVFILTFVISIRPIQELDRFKRMGIKAVLSNRHDREYYRDIVAGTKVIIKVMGASCTRFVEDFLDVKSDDKVLVDALRMNRLLEVQLLIPKERYMTQRAAERVKGLNRFLDPLKQEFGDRVQLRRFAEKAAHSFVIADNDLIAGPVFEGDESKHAPAVHVAMWTAFARKYTLHFDEVWKASVP